VTTRSFVCIKKAPSKNPVPKPRTLAPAVRPSESVLGETPNKSKLNTSEISYSKHICGIARRIVKGVTGEDEEILMR
jgi:hypothetical protein